MAHGHSRDPITGKRRKLRKYDPVEGTKLTTAEKQAEITSCGNELAEIRKEYAGLPTLGNAKVGALSVRYRRLELIYWNLTGTKPPPIWSDR